MLLTDLVAGCHNPWASVYDPSRQVVTAAKELATETLNFVAHNGPAIKPLAP
jgi:hypothetical protein